jgi:hypothetical protein
MVNEQAMGEVLIDYPARPCDMAVMVRPLKAIFVVPHEINGGGYMCPFQFVKGFITNELIQ